MAAPRVAALDPDIRIFRDLVQSGITPTAAYKRVYAATRKISDQAAYAGGLRKMRIINGLNPDQALTQSTTQRPTNHPKPQTVDSKAPANPREALLRRLWDAVNSDSNPEAISAVKQLRDWLREDEQRAESANVSDPAIIARHCASTLSDYADMDTMQRQDYVARVFSALESLGLPRADLLAGLQLPPLAPPAVNVDRAGAPPFQQTPVNIDPNACPISDPPAISDANQKSQCPLASNEDRK